jgi:uncharacterized protein DUF4128
MPSAAVEAAFQAKLASDWTQSTVLPDQTTEPPTTAKAFLVVQYPVQNSRKPSLQRRYLEEGAARLVLNVRSGIQLSYGLGLADSLAALFRTARFDGVETFVPSAPIINDQNDDGNWFELAVIVPYRYQFDS